MNHYRIAWVSPISGTSHVSSISVDLETAIRDQQNIEYNHGIACWVIEW